MGSAIADLVGTREVQMSYTTEWKPGTNGFVVEGELFHISPLSVSGNSLDFTSFTGKCSSTLFSLLFWLDKMGHRVFKVDDTMEISPMHPQFYQLTIQQKQTLEKQIKEGLAGISNSITDFELLFHDLRKYKDFLDYFSKRETALETKNKDMLMEAEQSLKAIFIDQVDVHTGEGVSLKHIAPRWPTIISDFMKMEDSDKNPKKIAKRYSVSDAEGVVLSTKNKLYIEWRETFEKTVKERYQRLLGMVQARKFSIDEYKNMLKPYIERYKSIKEIGSEAGGRKVLRKVSWLRPGAQATSLDFVTIWAFKAFTPPEPSKPSYENLTGKQNILKMPFCPSFKRIIRKNIKYLKDKNLSQVNLSKTGVEPLDKWVWALYKYIEDRYNIRFSLEELIKFRNEYVSTWGNEHEPYFKCFDTDVARVVIRLANGSELEDMTFEPILFYMETQNMMLLRFLEVKAQEKALEKYIDEMLGDTTKGKKLNELSSEYEHLFHVYPKEEKSDKEKKEEVRASEDLRKARDLSQRQIEREITQAKRPLKLFKAGPYHPRFDDIVTGPFFSNELGGSMQKVWNFLKANFEVPGAGIPGLK